MKKNIRIQKTNSFAVAILFIAILFFSACKKSNTASRLESQTTGYTQVACDEGFYRVLQDELGVFLAQNPDADIETRVTSEPELFRLLQEDSIHLAFAYREPTQEEHAVIKSHKRILRTQKIAIEGVALVINKSNRDSLISTRSITDILTGKIDKWSQINENGSANNAPIQVVFDHPQSSTVRYLVDSLTRGLPLSSNLRALKSSVDVLDYVAENTNALGIIGVSWISNPEDSLNLSFDDKIRVMSVSTNYPADEQESYKPYPAYLGLGVYPLKRDVYRILTDDKYSLSSGFATFVGGDVGQRIILRSGLVPGTRPTRLISLKDKFED